jgi:hypothetical protein
MSEKMPADMDQNAVRNEIVDEINTTFANDIPRKATLEDVDLSKSYKFYIVDSIGDLGSNNFEAVRKKLEKGVYIYEVPVFFGDSTYVANIQRYDQPLSVESAKLMTPEMIVDYERTLGTWALSVTYQYLPDTPFHDYYEMAAKSTGIRDTLPLLVGGIAPIHHPVALFPDKNGIISKLVYTKNLLPDEMGGGDLKKEGISYPVFDYEKAKDTILVLQKEAEQRAAVMGEPESGGDGFADFYQAYNANSR